jgi:hypothetical protein
MDWVKTITELIKALGHIAWPIVVVLIAYWFCKQIQKEIPDLIARILKIKVYGIEAELAEKKEVSLALENAKVGIPEVKIQEIEKAIQEVVTAKATVSTSASVKVRLIESIPYLIDLASKDPRDTIKRSWNLVALAVFQAAKVPPVTLDPYSSELSKVLNQLQTERPQLSESIRSIRNLEEIARRAFYQSQYAYNFSPDEALEFVRVSAALRSDLGDRVQ